MRVLVPVFCTGFLWGFLVCFYHLVKPLLRTQLDLAKVVVLYGHYSLVIRNMVTWLFYEFPHAMCGVNSAFTHHRDLFSAMLCVFAGFCGCGVLFGGT